MNDEVNNQSDTLLRKLLSELPLDSPSMGFEHRLKLRLEQEAARKRRAKELLPLLGLVAGVAVLLGFAVYLTVRFYSAKAADIPTLPDFSYNISFPTFGSQAIMVGVAVLGLLLANLYLRQHLSRKEKPPYPPKGDIC